MPTVISLMGGADAASSAVVASSLTEGHLSSSVPFWASFMAKARHVGNPHSLQLVCGSSL